MLPEVKAASHVSPRTTSKPPSTAAPADSTPVRARRRLTHLSTHTARATAAAAAGMHCGLQHHAASQRLGPQWRRQVCVWRERVIAAPPVDRAARARRMHECEHCSCWWLCVLHAGATTTPHPRPPCAAHSVHARTHAPRPRPHPHLAATARAAAWPWRSSRSSSSPAHHHHQEQQQQQQEAAAGTRAPPPPKIMPPEPPPSCTGDCVIQTVLTQGVCKAEFLVR